MTVRTIAEAKAQAKKLKTALAAQDVVLGHAQALEVIAHQSGARDWNTLSARLAKAALYLSASAKGCKAAISGNPSRERSNPCRPWGTSTPSPSGLTSRWTP